MVIFAGILILAFIDEVNLITKNNLKIGVFLFQFILKSQCLYMTTQHFVVRNGNPFVTVFYCALNKVWYLYDTVPQFHIAKFCMIMKSYKAHVFFAPLFPTNFVIVYHIFHMNFCRNLQLPKKQGIPREFLPIRLALKS